MIKQTPRLRLTSRVRFSAKMVWLLPVGWLATGLPVVSSAITAITGASGAGAVLQAADDHADAVAPAPVADPNAKPVAGAATAATAGAAAAADAAVVHKAGDLVPGTATLTNGAEKIEYELGTFYVPENRSDPKSRVISIGYARLKSSNPHPAPPTFHLPGGPGGSYMGWLTNKPAAFTRFLPSGDVVVIDQRGFSQRGEILKYSGQSAEEPLDQPASIARDAEAFVATSKAAVADCEKKGIDLRGYTVKECAEDVNDLAKALGYKQITLVGISYGSQWSFATMRLHPELVARAVLSGVEPLDMGFDSPGGVYGAMQRIYKEAEQDPKLKPYIPAGGLDAAVKAIAARFDKGPITVTVHDKDGDKQVVLGKADFQRELLQAPQDAAVYVLALYYEHYEGWAKGVMASRRGHGVNIRIIGPCIDTSLGITPARLKKYKADPAVALTGEWNWSAYVAAADVWPSADVGDDFRTPVKTDIPVVFAQGDWDTKTPFENTVEIAKSFPNSRVVIAEHGGHGVLEPIAQHCPKEWDQIMSFIATGELPALPEKVSLPMPKFNVPNFPAPGAETPATGAAAPAKDAVAAP